MQFLPVLGKNITHISVLFIWASVIIIATSLKKYNKLIISLLSQNLPQHFFFKNRKVIVSSEGQEMCEGFMWIFSAL